MIISSISMKNFQCYFGEHERNVFNFREGLNLVIGDNGGGKSKLFDAFYWVLYDQIFNSDTRRFLATELYKEKFISDKAKYECNVGDSVNVEVVLIAKSVSDKEYKITRIYKAKKIRDREWECDTSSRLLIDEYKITKWTSIESKKHLSILRMVIPDHLKPYMWFQGEQVDGLMDFTDKSTLTNAINLLSNITVYDDLIRVANKGHESATKKYRTAQNKLTKDEGKSKLLNKQLNMLNNEINKKTESIEKSKENLEIAKDKIEELIGQIEDATTKTELKKRKEFLTSDLDKSSGELSKKYNGLHKKMFTEYWVLKQSQVFFDKYAVKYKKYFESHTRLINSSSAQTFKLPINIPQPIHVSQMLEEEKCFVCNRDAKKGTDEYKYIYNLLKRDGHSEKKNIFINDCSTIFSKLYDNGLGFRQLINKIDSKIAGEFNEIQNLQNSINANRTEIDDIKSRFEELIEDDMSEDIVRSFRTHEYNREKYQSLISADEKTLDEKMKKSNEIETSLDKLVDGNIDPFIDKSNVIFKDLLEIAKSTRDDVFHNLIVELERKANVLFIKMTERNYAITGEIKLKRLSNGKYIPEIVGSDGYILSNPNDSNIILVKLALIMAIIISRGKWSKNFSLISDAPTAKMAEKYTHGFYETLGQEFKQSIVMTYDFINVDQRRELKRFNIGNIYTIEPHFPKNDTADNNDLEIIIKEIKL